jgi:Flp pilus assembly protein TadG
MAQGKEDSTGMMRGERGSVIILVGFIAFLLIMSVGVAVDMARAQILQQRISSALDAAGLAAAQTMSTPPNGYSTYTWVNSEATRYFNANFPSGYLGSSPVTVSATPSADNLSISLSATTSQSTVFMQTFGVNNMSVSATSTVTRNNNATGMELVLVLDDTGSMNGPVDSSDSATPKIQALGTAADELINILFGSNDTVSNLFVGIVPFGQAVSVPANVQSGSWMDGHDPNLANWIISNGSTWQGCVASRSASTVSTLDPSVNGTNITLDISEDPPSTAPFDEYFYPPNTPYYTWPDWSILYQNPTFAPVYAYKDPTAVPTAYYVNFNPWAPSTVFLGTVVSNAAGNLLIPQLTYQNGTSNPVLGTAMGPNVFCPPAVSPMMTSATQIISSITTLTSTKAEGDTLIDLGLAWGWRMLSPAWQGLWNTSAVYNGTSGTQQLPLPYNTTNMKKVVVLMSDGANYIAPGMFSGYGFLSDGRLGSTTSDPLAAAEDVDNRTLAVCQSLANDGVIIFTIGFGNAATTYPLTLAERRDSTIVDVNLLQTCANYSSANGGQFFLAPTNDQLIQAFKTIGSLLEQIRVSK